MSGGAPRLSVCGVVGAPADRLAAWLGHVRRFADEIVLSVDAAASPESIDVAYRYADDVAVVELGGIPNLAYGWTAERATGDWILVLDDDELLGQGFIERLPELMLERFTHFHLPVRWVVADEDQHLWWIRQFPWYPNHATRLFRNLRGGFRHPSHLHGSWEVVGEGRALPAQDDAILHLDLVLRDRAARERKTRERYRDAAGGVWATCEEYYLYEDYESGLERVRLTQSPDLATLLRPPLSTSGSSRPKAEQEDVVRRSWLLAHAADRSADPPIWSAAYLTDETPSRMLTNRGLLVTVEVENTSDATWRSRGDVTGRVVLSYRWKDLSGETIIGQGDITLLPQAVPPGERVQLVAGLWTPAAPGTYALEWDMLCERVGWFSERSARPASHLVEIVDDGMTPDAPHFATAPPQRDERPRPPSGTGLRRLRRSTVARLRRRLSAP